MDHREARRHTGAPGRYVTSRDGIDRTDARRRRSELSLLEPQALRRETDRRRPCERRGGADVHHAKDRAQLQQLQRVALADEGAAASSRGVEQRDAGRRVRAGPAGVLHRTGGPERVDLPPLAHRADAQGRRTHAQGR